jgi:hypothetical protein
MLLDHRQIAMCASIFLYRDESNLVLYRLSDALSLMQVRLSEI